MHSIINFNSNHKRDIENIKRTQTSTINIITQTPNLDRA